MINLIKYYKENVKSDDYYYRFYNEFITKPEKEEHDLKALDWLNESYVENILFEVFDLDEAIRRFQDLCEPNLDISYNEDNKMCFYLLGFYLNNNGYFIEEFPHLLERPPLDPTKFTIEAIRNRAFELHLDDDGTVRYQIRRKIVADLHFRKKSNNIKIDEGINELFEKISTRSAKFEEMSQDEKLKEIANLIEHMLIKDEKYRKLEYRKVCFEYLNDDDIKSYRNKIQCFRHAKDKSLAERKTFSDTQKMFLIEYGVIIIKVINEILKD